MFKKNNTKESEKKEMKLQDFENADGTPNRKFIKRFYKNIEKFLLSETTDKEERKIIKNKVKQLKKEID